MRRILDFVITGTPRSGTGYVARVLSSLGIICGHEAAFNPWAIEAASVRKPVVRLRGDCSWLAAPFLMELPASTKVFHVVRDPVNTINSILCTGQLDWPSDYRTFLARHFRKDSNYWPTEVLIEAQQFWVEWNEMIELSGRVTKRFQVESLRKALGDITKAIEPQWHLSNEKLEVAVNSVPTSHNSRTPLGRNNILTRSMLLPACVTIAQRYGYLLG